MVNSFPSFSPIPVSKPVTCKLKIRVLWYDSVWKYQPWTRREWLAQRHSAVPQKISISRNNIFKNSDIVNCELFASYRNILSFLYGDKY